MAARRGQSIGHISSLRARHRRHSVSIGLLIAAYVLVLYTSLAAVYARALAQLGPGMVTAPWPVVRACALALNGLVLALIPIRPRRKVGHLALRRASAHSSRYSGPVNLKLRFDSQRMRAYRSGGRFVSWSHYYLS